MKGQLILLPNALDPSVASGGFVTPDLEKLVPTLLGLIAESEKGARAFLKRFTFTPPKTFREMPIYLLNEHSSKEEIQELFAKIKKGAILGLISDCGLPVLADPGAQLVRLLRQEKISVEAYPGPSSILLALMLSGFSGQAFTFHGYLPRELPKLSKKIAELKAHQSHSHLFIEAPYRTEKLLKFLLDHLDNRCYLSLSINLTLPDQQVLTKKVAQWKNEPLPEINKKPAVFVVSYE